MTQIKPAPAEILSDWDVTENGTFKHISGRELSRKDWEIEIAYDYQKQPEVLIFAEMLSKVAENMEDESWL